MDAILLWRGEINSFFFSKLIFKIAEGIVGAKWYTARTTPEGLFLQITPLLKKPISLTKKIPQPVYSFIILMGFFNAYASILIKKNG